MNNLLTRRPLAIAALLALGLSAGCVGKMEAVPLSQPMKSGMPLTSPMYGGAGRGDTDALFPVGSGNQGVQADLAFQASPFMLHTAYRKMSSLDTDMAPDGAFGKVNEAFDSGASTKMFIEEQRPGGDLILGAIANHDTAAIDRGIKILQWGFKYQNSDGSFQTEDPFHSTSFFVESTAHAMLDLQGSQYASQYQPVIQDFTQRLVKAVHWMMEPDVEAAGIHKNRIFGHRRYLVACAMGETGVLAGDQEMIKHSENYIQDGLSIQTPEGYNPERGGPDSSYNAAGLLFADQYYTMVARPEMRQPLLNMLNKGVGWEVSQVLPTGEVNTVGNTRVGSGAAESDRAGVKKHVASSIVFRCLAYYSQISGDPNSLAAATNVAAFYRMYKP